MSFLQAHPRAIQSLLWLSMTPILPSSSPRRSRCDFHQGLIDRSSWAWSQVQDRVFPTDYSVAGFREDPTCRESVTGGGKEEGADNAHSQSC